MCRYFQNLNVKPEIKPSTRQLNTYQDIELNTIVRVAILLLL